MPKPGRERRIEKQLGGFIRQYGRCRHAGHDPNNRAYNREIEEKLKHLSPEQFNRLPRDENDG